jgi:hypothetical protein
MNAGFLLHVMTVFLMLRVFVNLLHLEAHDRIASTTSRVYCNEGPNTPRRCH